MKGKILVDIANPLDVTKGMPPTLITELCNTTSLGEEIQKAFPDSKVVKALNTVNFNIMVNPSVVKGSHDVFVCGNDAAAKTSVKEILKAFGWKNPVDLGDITAARGMEMYLPLWLRLWGAYQTPNFNISITK
jgi:predicted dinucleotide-binding enzyme